LTKKGLKSPKKQIVKQETLQSYLYKDLAEKMQSIMGTKVSVNQKTNGKGKIEIEYYSIEELERIFDLIMTVSEDK
jgi:ParB family chromosome partitioning protein